MSRDRLCRDATLLGAAEACGFDAAEVPRWFDVVEVPCAWPTGVLPVNMADTANTKSIDIGTSSKLCFRPARIQTRLTCDDSAVRRSPHPDLASAVAVGVAVTAASVAAPIIAYAAAPALAIAFWRTAMSLAVLVPVSLIGRREEFARLDWRRVGLLCVLAGVALSAHMATWVPSTKLTSIATASALVATQPVWQALIARAMGRRLPALGWIGLAVAVLGAGVATGADFSVSGTAVLGDGLALAGGMLAAVYYALGERVRATTSTATYTTICYSVCSLMLLAACLVVGVPLGGYPASAWLALAGLTIGPQLLGHSMLSFGLRRLGATTISVLLLLQVPLATLIGWLWLRQLPRPMAWPGLAMLVGGVCVVVLAGRRTKDRTIVSVEAIPKVMIDG